MSPITKVMLFILASAVGLVAALWIFILVTLLVRSARAGEDHRIRIAVIDTGLDLEDPRFKDYVCDSEDFTGEGIKDIDSDGHGTHVAGIIKQYAGDSGWCIIPLKYYSETGTDEENASRCSNAMTAAVNKHADVVNFSGGGPGFREREYLAVKRGLDAGIKFVFSVGNDHQNIDEPSNEYYPASYNPTVKEGSSGVIYVVGALGVDGRRLPSSSTSKRAVWELGENVLSTLPGGKTGRLTGTSMAAAIVTGKLVKSMLSKH